MSVNDNQTVNQFELVNSDYMVEMNDYTRNIIKLSKWHVTETRTGIILLESDDGEKSIAIFLVNLYNKEDAVVVVSDIQLPHVVARHEYNPKTDAYDINPVDWVNFNIKLVLRHYNSELFEPTGTQQCCL